MAKPERPHHRRREPPKYIPPSNPEEVREMAKVYDLDSIWPEELNALAEFHQKEAWVWEHVAVTNNENKTSKFTSADLAEFHRQRCRIFKELEALAEKEIDEYEREKESND